MIAAYVEALAKITASVAKALTPIVALYATGVRDPASKKDLAAAMLPIIQAGRERTHAEAVRFTKKRAKAAGVVLPEHLLPEAPGELTAGAIEAILYRSDSDDAAAVSLNVRRHAIALTRAPDRVLAESIADVSPEEDNLHFIGDDSPDFGNDLDEEIAIAREAKMRKRNRAAARKGAAVTEVPRRRWRYARIGTGKDDCGFCVMCIARGAVYSSARRAAGSEYHPGCDCISIVVFIDLEPEAQSDADAAYQLWLKAQDEIEGVEGTKNDALNRFRRYLAANKPEIQHSAVK